MSRKRRLQRGHLTVPHWRFGGQSANSELKHLGHGVDNITAAINALKATRPALVIQLKKSGKTRQARKTYKVAAAGIRAVEDMIANG